MLFQVNIVIVEIKWTKRIKSLSIVYGNMYPICNAFLMEK